MNFRSLRSRIVIFFALLLAAVLAVVFAMVTTASYQIARQQNIEDLRIGERVFHRLVSQNRQQLIQSAQVLTADFGFREAVTSNDVATIESALQNHRQRIGADVMMLFSLNGTPIAGTLGADPSEYKTPVLHLIQDADANGSAAGIVKIGGQAFDVVVVPVRAPELIAWVVLGFEVNDAFARDLGVLTSLQVSFLSQDNSGRWSVLASTQPAALRAALIESIDRSAAGGFLSGTAPIAVQGYESLVVRQGQTRDTAIAVVLQRSIAEAVARFNKLRGTLLALSAVSLIGVLLGSVLIARRITRPINALAELAHRMQTGDYTQTAVVSGQDEISAFALTFNHMRNAIVARESEIRRLAYEDGLTGLPNRMLFNDRLSQLIRIGKRKAPPFTVLVMDLDRFKYINDTLGHEAGDQVLNTVARRLLGVLRDSDTVARLGGDEFAILLASSDPHRVTAVVHRIQCALEENILVADQPVDVGCSIGIATFPEHGDDASTLMRHADIAMYVAKRVRSGYAVYDPSYDEHRREHLHLLGELRKAIEEDELKLVFQPKVSLATGQAVGVETLIRWQHPVRGMIPPGDFIPFAEHTGAIRMVTRWVIDKAVAECGEWLRTGLSLRVSFNISAHDLLNRDLPDILRNSLDEHKVPPEMICVEITESSLMEDPVNAQATLVRLRDLGVELAIDDYGTGYSSLAYIKNLPVNELKIDRAFVMNVTSHREDAAIVRSTVELGHNLGLRVVAEGVESEAELAILRESGCDEVQGYFIGRPMAAAAVQTWLNAGPWRAPDIAVAASLG